MDSESGEIRWRREQVGGTPLCDGNRLVLLSDTNQTSITPTIGDAFTFYGFLGHGILLMRLGETNRGGGEHNKITWRY